jgi:hypothetical protein
VFYFFQPGRRTSPLAIACVWLLLVPAVLRPTHSCGFPARSVSLHTEIVSLSPAPVCMACMIDTSTMTFAIILMVGMLVTAQNEFRTIRVKRRTSWSGSRLYLRPPPVL